MNLANASPSLPAVPPPLTMPSLAAVKENLAGGTLFANLRGRLPDCGAIGELRSVELAHEKHRRDSSALILRLGFAGGAQPAARELILYYPRAKDRATESDAHIWWYPDDPSLPALARVAGDPQSLFAGRWETLRADIALHGADMTVQRLTYQPGHRASFLLAAPRAGIRRFLKIVHRDTFDACVARSACLERSGLRDRILSPRLLGYSSRHCALLYEYLPGAGLDTLDRSSPLGHRLVSEAVRVLAEIHRLSPSGLPHWDPQAECARSRPLVDDLDRRYPQANIGRVFERLAATLGQRAGRSMRLIHNDFSAKNILYRPDVFNAASPGPLAIIDWDSAVLGSPERDMASLLSGLAPRTGTAGDWIDLYQRRVGRPLDRDLVNAFVQYQRLLKVCRRALKVGMLDEPARDAVHGIEAKLDHNPLVG